MGFIKATLLIVSPTLHHFLHLSVLSLLSFYLVKAFACGTSRPIFSGSLVFLYYLHIFKCLVFHSHPTPHPFLAASKFQDVLEAFMWVLVSASFAVCVNEADTMADVMKVCGTFGIAFVLELAAGTIYTARTLCRFSDCGEISEERPKWAIAMIKWSIDRVSPASMWIAGGAFLLFNVYIFFPFWPLSAVPSALWRWAAAGVCVGMLPLISLFAIAMQAALYRSCREHHNVNVLLS